MSDDDPIRFDDAAMFAAPPPRRPLSDAGHRNNISLLTRMVVADPGVEPAPVALVPRCPQCGFAYGIASHSRMVWKNRQQVEMTFCSEACGADYQIGSEG